MKLIVQSPNLLTLIFVDNLIFSETNQSFVRRIQKCKDARSNDHPFISHDTFINRNPKETINGECLHYLPFYKYAFHFINRLSKWLVSVIKADENDEAHHGDFNQPRQCGGRVRRFAIRGTHIHGHIYTCVYTRARVKRRYVSILPRWWIPRLRKEKSFDWNQTRPSPVQRILLFVSPRCRTNPLEIFSSPIAYPPFFHPSKLHAGTELSSICVRFRE